MKHTIPAIILLSIFSLASCTGAAQEGPEPDPSAPFRIALEPIDIPGLGGVQSYAFGQHDGKWLVLGGRLDGLHRRQPWATFDIAGHNTQLWVIDPASQQKWTANTSTLPSAIQEQLSSTNMQYHQEGKQLYCLGGYGYSASLGDHTTFDKLTAIHLPGVIAAITNGTDISPYFRQITDSQFQVTGGKLHSMGGKYYLLGGQKFLGRYNPMGPNSGPGFIQEYTNSIRVFSLQDDGETLTVQHLPSYTDSENLHRRDYNAVPQIMPDGSEGLTMFSGVFQHNADLPFLNSVDVDTSGYLVNDDFQQYYNHYHCPVLPIYSSEENEMHTIFFGGIAQFYDNNGTLVQDDNVPFVKTIARVTRDANGQMTEYKLPIEMPDYLGASAELIPQKDLPYFDNHVLKLDSLTADSTLVGHIFGGINSSDKNIFFINEGDLSTATPLLFRVYVIRDNIVGSDELNQPGLSSLNVRVFPNPSNGVLNVGFHLKEASNVKLTLHNTQGSVILSQTFPNVGAGEKNIRLELENLYSEESYLITLETQQELFTQKLILGL